MASKKTGILTKEGQELVIVLALAAGLFWLVSVLEDVREQFGVNFQRDMNGDGMTTISDVGQWIKSVFFWPGDTLFALMLQSPSRLATFWELGLDSFGGWMSAILSIVFWSALLKVASRG